MRLYSYFRSGTSHRTRIALNLKELDYDIVPVNLLQEEHLGDPYKTLNPQGLVPTLEVDGQRLIQSPAIIEWLEERYPAPPLLPAGAEARARVRGMAAVIGCDIHPINNRRILEALRHDFKADEATVNAWCGRWIHAGFSALETLLAQDGQRGDFCHGGAPGLVECYLIPQVESSRRFKVDLTPYPHIRAIDAACAGLDAFRRAAPVAQPDAPSA